MSKFIINPEINKNTLHGNDLSILPLKCYNFMGCIDKEAGKYFMHSILKFYSNFHHLKDT